MNLKDKILACDDLASLLPVAIPEWDVTVHVRRLSRAEVLGVQKAADQDMAALVLACCDETKAPLFTTSDIPALNRKSPAAIKRILDAIVGQNVVEAGTVDDAKKD